MTPQDNIVLCICGDSNCTIPYGLCHCGCGRKTTVTKYGVLKGRPIRFIHGHQGAKSRVDIDALESFEKDGVFCRLIPLTRGKTTIVWELDYEYLSQWRWYAQKVPGKNKYYAVRADRDVNGKEVKVKMHRVILGLDHGDPRFGDHIKTEETLNNKRTNLRIADRSQSQCNRSMPKNNTIGVKGVRWNKYKGKYQADINVNGKHYNLGYSDTIEGAYEKYKEGVKKYHGEFGNSGGSTA